MYFCITSIKMKPSITLGVLCALFSNVAALTCYQCIPDTDQKCTDTGTCSGQSCASITVNAYEGGKQAVEVNSKRCLPSESCTSWSMNFGTVRTTMSTKCCKTDRCNSQKTSELNPNTLNGKKCFTCEGGDCTKMMSCFGNEDRCIKATDTKNGKTTILKGCASSNICIGDVSTHIGSEIIDIHCCEGHLCNSGKSVGRSVMLLLGSLVSVLLFH
ncbi:urokinase plasminogen activator surface receptor-like [Alosa sapidissima]|uniref:urokinase plasminogen activator surface receptor-like n=1 Tax=Alosa sapidissima TaxID=34773 RepID=UPI001C0A269B|nr:urokinase plasminogen activator surface receptor-like [Alosa sapidissima]